jgi:CHAT domain-containing protein
MPGPSNHVRMQTVSGTCPDPEALAAFVDQGSSAAEHVQVEAHLAACDDCRLLVARILETQSAVQGADAAGWRPVRSGDPRRAAAFSRKHVVWGTASLVAAAAVLAVAVTVGVDPSAYWRSLRAGSKLADLAAAVGDERTIEPRLTGGFHYGPLRAAVRSGGSSAARDHWTLYAAAGRIREVADRDPSAPNLHALGLAHLVLGQYDEAVRALEDAVSEDPDQPRYQSDLSAAYLARARQLDRPDDLPRALGATERAVKGDERLLEARFNRALALEALFLEDQARQAWEDYLARDSSSGWANDARSHLQKLQKEAVPPPQGSDNSPPPITDTTVEAGLDWLLRHGLRAWADAVLADDDDRAAREQKILSEYAQQLTRANGDALPAALASTAADSPQRRRRATAMKRLGRGLTLRDADDMAAAEQLLREACVDIAPPLSALCDVELGMFDVLHRDQARALARVVRARKEATDAEFSYVEGRAERLEGYGRMFVGDYAPAVDRYRVSFEIFERGRYRLQAASLATQLAGLYDVIGLPVDAWRWRVRALEAVARITSPIQRYWTHLSTSLYLARAGQHDAAQSFLPVQSDITYASVRPLQWVYARLEHARSVLARSDTQAARDDVSAINAVLANTRDFRAATLLPLVRAMEASILHAEGKFDDAQRAFDSAISAFGPERALYKASALLERAAVRVSIGENLDTAEQDVQAAIALLSQRSVGEPIRLDDARGAFRAVASLVSAEPALRTMSGLFLADQLEELLDGVPEGVRLKTRDAFELALKVPPDTVAYYFLFGDDSLLTWVIRPGDVQFVHRPISDRLVQRLAARLEIEVARSPTADVWMKTLADLYDLLLRDLPSIDGAAQIVILPEGPLYRVPFGALRDTTRSQFLFERAVVRIAPNLAFATAANATAKTAQSSARLLSIGEPELRDGAARGLLPLDRARREAHTVAGLYESAVVLLGDKATKADVLRKLPEASVIHFAGHALPASATADARLLLAGSVADPSSALTAQDLIGRVARARVVLAACETASDSGERVSGVTSIAATFLRAGASSVVGTLWQVDDAAAEQFFVDVHRALASGQPAAMAVTRAQRSCYASPSCRTAAATWIGASAYGVE